MVTAPHMNNDMKSCIHSTSNKYIMKIIYACVFLLIASAANAQTPQSMSYQAVVRNAANQLVQEGNVGVRISILQGTPAGAAVYQENHTATTNLNGLLTLEVGMGSILVGTFAGINWENGPYFIQSEIDPTGGNNYSITTTSQLLAVPYALHAKTSSDAARIKTLIYTGF
jgi:hypothetical protein